MYRAVVFTHEIAHGRARWFGRFEALWNVLCGIPMLLPSFFYGDHHGHHAKNRYSTASDPEYLLHGSASTWRIACFLALPIVYPLLPPIRFLVLTPLALVSRVVDRFAWQHGSSLYNMNEAYLRDDESGSRSRSRWLQEIACCAWAWTVVGLVLGGLLPWVVLVKTYALFVFWESINQWRTFATHRYTNHDGMPISHVDQVRDTFTFPHGWLIPHLWAPVGLRYHALHHLIPAMPYHALPLAHRRLIEQLPSGSPYHETLARGLVPAIRTTLRDRQK